MADLPTGHLTFIMADVLGSEEMWEAEPERMRLATVRLDALVSKVLDQTKGYLIKPRGEGDSVHMVFYTPKVAIEACCLLLRACINESWELNTPILPRFAVLTGEGQLRGSDYYGSDLNRCARLRAITHPGQIIICESVWEAVHGALPNAVGLKFLGSHKLKDFENPERIWQILHADLPSQFPRLTSPPQHNLPQSTTRFVGREKEIHEAQERLAQTRLLTLTGSGGCGKTRLSIEVANQRIDLEPDGVWFVELAPLANATLVPRAVAQVLGIADRSGEAVIDTLVSEINAKQMLLLFDNCEHIVGACSNLIESLLHSCPNVRIITSSREPLGVANELTYRVPSLRVPDVGKPLSVEELKGYESVSLFMDRVQAQVPSFELTEENASSVAQICNRLDGIPLALELAAARVRSLPVDQVATRLDNRFRLLTGGSRSSLPRQQTLRALIDWSYDLLNDAEKMLLCRLSVFTGGWQLEAGQTVCSGAGMPDKIIREVMDSLTDKSLAILENRNGQPRYRLLETVRQYGLDKLMERGEGVLLREQHRDYFLRHVEQCSSLLMGPLQVEGLKRLEIEHDNVRRALEWCLGDPEGADRAMRFVGSMWRFWMMRGHLNEGRTLLSEALGKSGGKPKSLHRAQALTGAGVLAWCQGDYAEARRFLEESLTMRRALGDQNGVAQSLNNLGLVYMEQSDYQTAREMHEEALDIRRDLDDEIGIHTSLNNLGNLAFFLGDYDKARERYEESLAIRRQIGDRQSMSHSLYNLGLVLEQKGDIVGARSLHEESLALRREFDDPQCIAYSLNSLASLAHSQKNWAQTRVYLDESRSIFQSLGDNRGLAQTWIGLGDLGLKQSHLAEASLAYSESLKLLQQLKDRWSTARLLDSCTELLTKCCLSNEAVQLAGAAQALRDSIGVPRSADVAQMLQGTLQQLQDTLSEETYKQAWGMGYVMSIELLFLFAESSLKQCASLDTKAGATAN